MSDVWCPLPWVHQFVTTTGVKMCCSSGYEEASTPAEFENSAELNIVKQSILNNQPHSHCNNCYEMEREGLTSTRQRALQDYPNLNPSNIEHKITYYDLRYNNLCNFSCRMCSPDFSSTISKEVSDNPHLAVYYNNIVPRKNNYENIVNSIDSNLANVNRIMFTGGEPLLIKDNLKILQKLIDLGNTSCQILITTNCSVINNDWIQAIKQFKKIHWTLSLDGIGLALEYIRNGADWPTIKNNVETLLDIGHSVSINATLTAYSVLDISRLVEYFIELQPRIRNFFELWFGTCQYPAHLNPNVLTTVYAERARQELEKSIQLITGIKQPERSLLELTNVLKTLNTNAEPKNFEKFAAFTKDLDLIRNQSFSKTFNLENPYV